MKLIRSEQKYGYKEIEVERNYIFWKTKTIYRNYDGTVFEYKSPNIFKILGLCESSDIKPLFKINP